MLLVLLQACAVHFLEDQHAVLLLSDSPSTSHIIRCACFATATQTPACSAHDMHMEDNNYMYNQELDDTYRELLFAVLVCVQHAMECNHVPG